MKKNEETESEAGGKLRSSKEKRRLVHKEKKA